VPVGNGVGIGGGQPDAVHPPVLGGKHFYSSKGTHTGKSNEYFATDMLGNRGTKLRKDEKYAQIGI